MLELQERAARSRRWILRSALALGTLAALGIACADTPERTETRGASQALGAALKWTVASSEPFIDLAPKSDGSVLATTRRSVLAIDPAGNKTVLFEDKGKESVGPPHVLEGVDGFLVRTTKGAVVHDAAGAKTASLSLGTNEYARLIPGSLGTFAPHARSTDPENGSVDEGRVFSETGVLAAKFPSDGLLQSRTTKSSVFWATRSSLTKTKLDGGEVWSAPIAAHRFETDVVGRFFAVNRTGDTRVLELYEESNLIGKSTFDAPLWNVAIAPNGIYAAACSKKVLRLFKGGKLVATIPLAGVYPVSLDVSERGDVLLGTQDERKKTTGVSLFDASGAAVWNASFDEDTNAYRPDVRFMPDGKGFFVRGKAGISFYAMEGV